ncbi:MAG: protein kinase, partial [Candidatus Hydrogenedentes bacterium]|nr:protein kinase [Candidatus Hydrogenedentota bacterium]
DKIVVERFFNEARIARRLAHPNIVRVHDIGSAENFVYISMEFIKGHSLRGILEKLPPGQRLPILETLRILDQLCASLEYAHQFTIHRDIKPENVMLDDASGSVKLMDFGISKLMANTQLTGASMVMGTPYYMSPEQLRNSRDVDARADIFSIGVMLYEILTGNMPTGVPRPASQIEEGLPPSLDAIVARCVDPNPEKRFANATELRAALKNIRDIMEGETTERRPKVAAPSLAAWPLQKVAGATLAVVLLAFAAVGLYGLESRRQRLASGAENAPLSIDTATPVLERYQRLEELLAEVEAKVGKLEKSEAMSDVFERGKELRAQAKGVAAEEPERALQTAREALQFLLAPRMAPEDMAFVPPDASASNTPDAGAFFMDLREVTVKEFWDFCQKEAWRFPAQVSNWEPEMPVAYVSNFDARAYAAAQGKLLPTPAQWLRATYDDEDRLWQPPGANIQSGSPLPLPVGTTAEDTAPNGCLDLTGNIAEWTRPAQTVPEAGSDSAALFGKPMEIRGGDFLHGAETFSQTRTASFEATEPYIGFRCVLPIPTNEAGARYVLANLG